MRLVDSSEPDAVGNADDLRLLCERLALANAVCHALDESGERLVDESSDAALGLLLDWVRQHCPTNGPETLVWDGLDEMRVPPGAEDVRQRLDAATGVCGALAWLYTADTSSEFEDDGADLDAALDWWRRLCATILPAPRRPAFTRVQRLTLEYARGACPAEEIVDALLVGPTDADPPPWRPDMDGWPGVVYMESARYLTRDQFVTLLEAFDAAVLAAAEKNDPPPGEEG